MGDLDMDKEVTIFDVTILQRHLADMVQLTNDQKTVSDVDASKEIDSIDAVLIQRFLENMRVAGSRVGKYEGEAPSGKYTYNEFINSFNALNTLFAKYNASQYGSNAAYQAASNALNTYRAATYDPKTDPNTVDAGYEACTAAYAALAAVPITEQPTQGGDDDGDVVTLYFSNNKGWSGVNVYMWNSAGGESTEWPGATAEKVATNDYGEDIYAITIDTSVYDGVIFNGSGGQTADVDVAYAAAMGCGIYCLDTQNDQGHYEVGYYEYSGPTGGGGGNNDSNESFLLTDNFGWGSAYVYAWDADGNELNGAWPGSAQAETVINDYGETQFRCYVPDGAIGVILSNGNGAQTEDITDFSHAGYWMDGTQNDLGHYVVTAWD